MGRIEGGIRLPMTPLEARNNEQVMLALRQSGVLA
jgi:dihydrodipicolinate synthase/N-acetylneuraminate lyase